jgi:ATP-dependent DNA helicase RecG
MSYKEIQPPLPFEQPSAPPLISVGEIYDKADQSLLQQLKEDRRIERKSAGVSASELGIYFSQWANTPAEGGLIAVGIEDNGSISGCLRTDIKHINRLEEAWDIYTPDARCESKHIPVQRADGEQDFVLLIRVFYNQKRVVRTTKGEAWIRLGGRKKKLTEEEIKELEIDKGQIEFEQELTEFQYPQDFNFELIQQYGNSFRKEREGRLRDDITDEEILELRHLGKIEKGNFIPNIACVLAFAKDPQGKFPGCKIRFLRFEGEIEGTGDRWNPIKDISLDQGSVPLLIAETEKIIDSQLRTFTRLGTDNKFHTVAEYPKQAWYEALVNACVHRSYNLKNMNIFIRMFDDRIEIESPGGFPPLVTPENIYETEHPRNPHLFNVMFYLKLVRAAREGTRRIRDSMKLWELPKPEFSQKESGYPFVRVTLRNDYKQRKQLLDSDAISVIGELVFMSLTSDQKYAINYAVEHGKVKTSDLMRLLQSNWHHCKRVLEGLKTKGIFGEKRRKDIARDSQGYYFLKRPNGK